LRANATLALVSCTDLARVEILRHLVNALANASDKVRLEAVRALEQMNGDESNLLLRLKAHSGDSDPDVLGQVFDSLLQLERERAVPFIATFLKAKNEEVCSEAALALGASRLPAAVAVLIETWKQGQTGQFASVLLRALSSSRDETALAFLLGLIREGSVRHRSAALEALALHKDSPEIQTLIDEARKQGERMRNGEGENA
jgi:HEAT repeat protein